MKFGKDTQEIEGLVHISEIDWQIIDDPADFVKIGDKVQAKIIEISNGRASLSLKALKEDPWTGIETKYKVSDIVKGSVTKFNPFGALSDSKLETNPNSYFLCFSSSANSASVYAI